MTERTNSQQTFASALLNEVYQSSEFQRDYQNSIQKISEMSPKEAQDLLQKTLKPSLAAMHGYNKSMEIIGFATAENKMQEEKLKMTIDLVEKTDKFDPKLVEEGVKTIALFDYTKPVSGNEILKFDLYDRFKTASKKPITGDKSYMIQRKS